MSPLPVPATPEAFAVVAAGYHGMLATSGAVVTNTLDYVPSAGRDVSTRERDVGVLVGKCENVLALTFVLGGAHTALAVVFAAKGIVRKDDIEKNTLFYLAGTLVNLTYSVLVGVLVVLAVAWL
jgi:hypothetical protein